MGHDNLAAAVFDAIAYQDALAQTAKGILERVVAALFHAVPRVTEVAVRVAGPDPGLDLPAAFVTWRVVFDGGALWYDDDALMVDYDAIDVDAEESARLRLRDDGGDRARDAIVSLRRVPALPLLCLPVGWTTWARPKEGL